MHLGVPHMGTYKEILNSDDERFGGSGIINTEPLKSNDHPANRCPYSVTLDVPPLGMVILEQLDPPKKKKAAPKKKAASVKDVPAEEKTTEKKPAKAKKAPAKKAAPKAEEKEAAKEA